MSERRFPIQGEQAKPEGYRPGDRIIRREPGWVPWGIAEEAYKTYASLYGKEQSLETLAARGGFGWSELVRLLQGKEATREFRDVPLGSQEP